MKNYLLTFCCNCIFLFQPIFLFAQNFSSSNLPIVVINTYGQLIDTAYVPKIMGMGIIYNGQGNRNYLTDPFNNYNGEVEIKLRGTSSLGFPKKSFKVTTLDSLNEKANVPILDMPAENDWVLKGIYPDKTLMRDELTFWLYSQMGHYSSRTVFFELVVNNSYCGVYCMMEKIKRDKFRVDISSLKPDDVSGDDVTGGYIIKLDKFKPGEEGWYSNYFSNSTHDSANYFLFEYPKPDSMPQEQKNYIKNFMDGFENTLASPWWNNADSGYGKYINVPSFIDNFIINEISRNVDGYRSSTFFYKDKDTKGDGKLHNGPIWDFDIAWNNCYYNGGNNPAGWQYRQFTNNHFVPFWWWQLMSDTAFTNQLKCRYMNLRNSILSVENIFNHIDSVAAYLEESQARNFTKWPILGQFVEPNPTPVPATYAEEISSMKNFIQQRLAWLDANMPGACPSISVSENMIAENTFRSYPNPFRNSLNVSYKLPDDSKVKIKLLNVMGEEVALLYHGNKTAGMYYEEFSAPHLAAGIYMVKLSADELVFHQKIVKIEE